MELSILQKILTLPEGPCDAVILDSTKGSELQAIIDRVNLFDNLALVETGLESQVWLILVNCAALVPLLNVFTTQERQHCQLRSRISS